MIREREVQTVFIWRSKTGYSSRRYRAAAITAVGERNRMFNGDMPFALGVGSCVTMPRLGVSEPVGMGEHKAGTRS